MDLRLQQKAERRERILAAAREIIGERGYQALTMRDLARSALVTVPTIYNLIGGKEAVLFAAVEEQTDRFLGAIERSRGQGPASLALSVIDSCVDELLRAQPYYRSLLFILLTSDAASEVRSVVDAALVREFERALDELRAEGNLASWIETRPLAEGLAAQLQFAGMRWAIGLLESQHLRDAAVYGAGLLLLGALTGAGHRDVHERVVGAQTALAAESGRPRSAPSRARSAPNRPHTAQQPGKRATTLQGAAR